MRLQNSRTRWFFPIPSCAAEASRDGEITSVRVGSFPVALGGVAPVCQWAGHFVAGRGELRRISRPPIHRSGLPRFGCNRQRSHVQQPHQPARWSACLRADPLHAVGQPRGSVVRRPLRHQRGMGRRSQQLPAHAREQESVVRLPRQLSPRPRLLRLQPAHQSPQPGGLESQCPGLEILPTSSPPGGA